MATNHLVRVQLLLGVPYASLAQRLEQCPLKAGVGGSNPLRSTKLSKGSIYHHGGH